MQNEIIIHPDKNRTIIGKLAHELAFHRWEELIKYDPKIESRPRFTVVEIPELQEDEIIIRAVQNTREGAMRYMKENRVLVCLAD